jgi:hypothetical protein
VVPLIQIAQAIGKIFDRSLLRQHERKRTLFETLPARGLAATRRDACLATFPPNIGDRADVLTKLVNNWPNSRLAELTPWAWAAAH